MTELLQQLQTVVGTANLITGADSAAERYSHDWKHAYSWKPLAIARPANSAEVSELVRLAAAHRLPVVPFGGNTGLNGGTSADNALVISLERMRAVREIRPVTRVAIVEGGAVLSEIHAAADAHDMVFPLTFGARGSAQIGGCLSTNAGGSNVLRYGNARQLALGIEVVLPDGRLLNLMSELHKDNTGYDLRDLFIGAEGTLGIITAATLRLAAKPSGFATGMVAVRSIPDGLDLLNDLNLRSGGQVEAFEYMPRCYMEALAAKRPDLSPPLGHDRDHTIMVELGATAPGAADQVQDVLESALAAAIESGRADDAIVAQNLTQRQTMWGLREISAEVVFAHANFVDTDVAVPLDAVAEFLARADAGRIRLDPASGVHVVSHLGDGNIHYTALPSTGDPVLHESIREMVEDVALGLGGSFSAEHGIGLSKRGGMARRKDPVALDVMRQIKLALDPENLMNPGKVLPR